MDGNIIHGIVKKYKSSSAKIRVGDFITFITQNLSAGTDTKLSNTNNVAKLVSATELDENRVFIAYSAGNGGNLYGIVCDFSGNTVALGTETQITTGVYSNISAVKVSDNKVFIAYGKSSSAYLNGIVCIINNLIITIGSEQSLLSETSGYMNSGVAKVVALEENKVFIFHLLNPGIYAVICTINGTTISVWEDTQIASSGTANISIVKLKSSKIFVLFESNVEVKATICSINENSILLGTVYTIISSATYTKINAIKLSETKVFIAFSAGASTYPLSGLICSINNTTIVKGTGVMLSNATYAGYIISTVKLTKDTVCIIHSYDNTNMQLYGLICKIDGTNITAETDVELSSTANAGYAIFAILFNDKDVFIAHNSSSNYNLYGMLINDIVKAKLHESSSEDIAGISKNAGTNGNTIKVYVPEVEA